jgi:hypothetical protein
MELCPAHQFASVGSCTRCGRFVCAQCRRWMAEKPFCSDCLGRLGHKPSGQAVVALLLATLGLALLLPGLVAFVLARRELGRIERGEAPEAGRDFVQLARGLAIFETLVAAGALVVLVLRGLG